MKRIKKGNYGYINYQKKKSLLITMIMFAIPLTIFFTGIHITGNRLNLFTVVAILGCLPACKSLVGLIMIMLQKEVDRSVYERACAAAKDLVCAYDLSLTTYEHTYPVNCAAICGNQIVCYCPDEKAQLSALEKHIRQIMNANEYYGTTPKVCKDFHVYLQRVADLAKDPAHYQEGIEFTPDERYPDLSREELIKHTLLAISL